MEFKAKGNRAYGTGNAKEAVTMYTQGIELVESGGGTEEDKASLHLLYSNRSLAHLDLCMPEEALQDAECAIEVDPDYAKAYSRRAAVLIDLFKFKEAITDLNKAELLDPAMKSTLKEFRLRATGKKWVPNCYLRKQRDLQRRLQCEYVLLSPKLEPCEDEEGEEEEEPLTDLSSASGCSYFKKAMETGTGTDQGMLLVLQSAKSKLIRARGAVFETEQAEIEMDLKHKAQILSQLRREYGPDKKFEMTEIPPPKQNWSSITTCHLYISTQGHRCLRNRGFSPDCFGVDSFFCVGQPSWLNDPNKLLDNIEFYSGGADVMRQAGAGLDRETLVPVAQQMKDYRRAVFGTNRPAVCQGCGIFIPDPDTPECLCGAYFCGIVCHTQTWPKHQAQCRRNLLRMGTGGCFLTVAYWDMVLRGYYRLKDTPDFKALWRERQSSQNADVKYSALGSQQRAKQNTELLDTMVAESSFYEQEFNHYIEAELSSVIAMPQRSLQTYGHLIYREHINRFLVKLSEPVPGDSPAMIVGKLLAFKVHRMKTEDNVQERGGNGVGSLSQVIKKFQSYLRKNFPKNDDLALMASFALDECL